MYYKRVNRGLSFTRPGLCVFGLVLLIGMIAVTTSINGLYVFLSAGLGGFIISGLLSEKAMKSCNVLSVGAELVDAATPFPIAFTIENVSPWFTAYALKTVFLLDSPRFRLVARNVDGIASVKAAKVPAAGRHVYSANCTGLPRGSYRKLLAMQQTTFPFGILEKFKLGEIEADLLIAPRIDAAFLAEVRGLVRQKLAAAEAEKEFFAHRPYTTRDSPRDLDWKKSASRPQRDWVMKQYKAAADTPLCLDAAWSYAVGLSTEAAYEAFLSRVRTALKALDECGIRYTVDFGGGLTLAGHGESLAVLARAPEFPERAKGLKAALGAGRREAATASARLVVRLDTCHWTGADAVRSRA